MSGYDHGAELDLDALVDWAATERPETEAAVSALAAEVQRLREEIDQCWVPLLHDARNDRDCAEAEVRRLRALVSETAAEAVSIAATAVRSQGETDPDIADSTLRSLSRRSKALADRLRE